MTRSVKKQISYTEEEVKNLFDHLKSLPKIERPVVKSRQEVVTAMLEEIESLKTRGYSLNMIAEEITKGGLAITAPTLKNYLQRAKPVSKAKQGAKASVPKRGTKTPTTKQAESSSVEPEKAVTETQAATPAHKQGSGEFRLNRRTNV